MIQLEEIDRQLRELSETQDFEIQHLTNGDLSITLYFYSSLINSKLIQERISEPFSSCHSYSEMKNILDAELFCEQVLDEKEMIPKLLEGYSLITLNDTFFSFSSSKVINNKVDYAKNEASVQGPSFALTEDSFANINLIRRRYASSNLIVKEKEVGKKPKAKLYVLYDKHVVKETVLQELLQKIDDIQDEFIQASGQLENLLSQKKFNLVPLMLVTERPDRIVFNLSHGKIVILVNGSPFALIAPAVFYDFMSAMDDRYQTYWVGIGLVILRYISLFLTMCLPAMYIAVISHNPEIFQVQFALSIAGSRAPVPYSSFVEVLFMLFLIEVLIEASIRLPKYIGSTATTVGGLILGQAAQEAGLVSSVMIIITSTVAIANFVVPINEMSFAIRLVKYPLIVFATLFGILGLISGVFCFLVYLVNLRSYGEPFFRLQLGEHASTNSKKRISE
ncbi:spore germination protein [Brevibacillus sp. NPDC003359]|uniref:spore germination protein n=1 Tax=unclassified Brevibacillus TaxID=2684853 RepID=UPI0036C6B3D4